MQSLALVQLCQRTQLDTRDTWQRCGTTIPIIGEINILRLIEIQTMMHNHPAVTGLHRTQLTQPQDMEESQVIEVLVQHVIQSAEPTTSILHPGRLMYDTMAGAIGQVQRILDLVQQWTEICKIHVPTLLNLLQVLVRMTIFTRFNKCAMINNSVQMLRVVKAVGSNLRTETMAQADRVVGM